MARVSGLKSLESKLSARARLLTKKTNVVVGYTAAYALYVHEDLQAAHPNGGRAKYLEEPARTLSPQLAAQVRADVGAGRPLDEALLRAGLLLQRESMLLVPVDTGALRASAFTKKE